MVGRGNHDGVDGLIVQHPPKIFDQLRFLGLTLCYGGSCLLQSPLVDVTNGTNPTIRLVDEAFCQGITPVVGAHHAKHDRFVG